MLNVLQGRHLKYIFYFFGLVTVGSGGFYIIVGIYNTDGQVTLNNASNLRFSSGQKIIIIGSQGNLKLLNKIWYNDV